MDRLRNTAGPVVLFFFKTTRRSMDPAQDLNGNSGKYFSLLRRYLSGKQMHNIGTKTSLYEAFNGRSCWLFVSFKSQHTPEARQGWSCYDSLAAGG